MVAKDLVSQAYPLVALIARRPEFSRLPPGVSVDDLESHGGEALLEAAATYDPSSGEESWPKFARAWLRNAMRSYVQNERRKSRRRADLEVETEDGDRLPRPDPRAADPGELASAREALARPGRRTLSVKSLRGQLPTPAQVADKVAELREAMFSKVSAEDVADVMAGVVARAKEGDHRAARLLLDYLQPGRSGVTVQQAVVVNASDVS